MSEINLDETWPKGSQRDDFGDAQKLLEFIDREILTTEFVQALDPEFEQELAAVIRKYQATRKQILQAIQIMRGDGCAPR